MIQSVDQFFAEGCGRCDKFKTADCKVVHFRSPLLALRQLLQSTGLKEDLKWSQAAYTYKGKVVVLLSAYTSGATVSFFNGSLLRDPEGLLSFAGPNSHQDKIIRLSTEDEVNRLSTAVLQFIEQSIELIERGIKPEKPQAVPEQKPQELLDAFQEDESLQAAFEALTPGRQRGYLIHFNGASKSETRQNRIQKHKARILRGLGIHDK